MSIPCTCLPFSVALNFIVKMLVIAIRVMDDLLCSSAVSSGLLEDCFLPGFTADG